MWHSGDNDNDPAIHRPGQLGRHKLGRPLRHQLRHIDRNAGDFFVSGRSPSVDQREIQGLDGGPEEVMSMRPLAAE